MKNEQYESNDKTRFFSEEIEVDVNRIYPMLVMATMSSGKSTLINALLGMDILPNSNKACTAKIYSILDDDTVKKPKLYLTAYDEHVSIIEDNLREELEQANNSDEIRDILISGEVKGILNTEKALLIIDTPGPNNSRDVQHEKITKNILQQLSGGLILYVINVTQMCIHDDQQLLLWLKEYLKKNKNISVVFVLNKMDQIDFERESVTEMIMQAKEYLELNGFEKPDILPISALAANLFKKVLKKAELTRNEYRDFLLCYELFKPISRGMQKYTIINGRSKESEKVDLKGEKYSVAELEAAIDNTGITYLEKYVQNKQILSSESKKVKINVK